MILYDFVELQSFCARHGSCSSMPIMLDAARLRAFPLLAHVNEVTQQRLSLSSRLLKVQRDEPILAEGEPASAVFALLQGRARVLHLAPDGREFLTRKLHAPVWLGEAEVISELPTWLETVIASERCEIVEVPAEAFRLLLRDAPELTQLLLRDLSRGLCCSMVQVCALALYPLEARLASHLLACVKSDGQSTYLGTLVTQRPTLDQLAALTGSARRSVVRVLGSWKRAGAIDRVDGRFVIRNLEWLQSIAAPSLEASARQTLLRTREKAVPVHPVALPRWR